VDGEEKYCVRGGNQILFIQPSLGNISTELFWRAFENKVVSIYTF